MSSETGERLDRMFHALADGYRRGMVEQLSHGPASVKELAAPAGIALPSALKHLRVLEEGDIVVSQKTGRVRTFRIKPQALNLIETWVTERKRGLNHAFDRLERLMAEHPEDPQEK